MSFTATLANGGRLSGLSSSTPAVLLHSSLANRFNDAFDYATNSGSVFSFFKYNVINTRPLKYVLSEVRFSPLTLTIETLSGCIVGGYVLLDDGSGKWRIGTLIGNDAAVQIGGDVIPATARAAQPIADNGQSVQTGAYKLTGTAADGSAWFMSSTGLVVICGPLTTVDALGSGVSAIVEVSSGNWTLATL